LTDLARWLDERRPPAPASLRRAMLDALDRGDPGSGPRAERLATAAMAALARVTALPSTRDRAIELLAADALLTYACEAAVTDWGQDTHGGEPLALLGETLDLECFARLLPGAGTERY
jgi:hypothetical protein